MAENSNVTPRHAPRPGGASPSPLGHPLHPLLLSQPTITSSISEAREHGSNGGIAAETPSSSRMEEGAAHVPQHKPTVHVELTQSSSPDGVNHHQSSANPENVAQEQDAYNLDNKVKLPHAPSDWSGAACPSHQEEGRAPEPSGRVEEGTAHAPPPKPTVHMEVAPSSQPSSSLDVNHNQSSSGKGKLAHAPSDWSASPSPPTQHSTNSACHEGKLPHAPSDWSGATPSHPLQHGSNSASHEVQGKLPHTPSDWSGATPSRPLQHSSNSASHEAQGKLPHAPSDWSGTTPSHPLQHSSNSASHEAQGKLPYTPSDWSGATPSHPLQHGSNSASHEASHDIRNEPHAHHEEGRTAEARGRAEEGGARIQEGREPTVCVEVPPACPQPSSSFKESSSQDDVKHGGGSSSSSSSSSSSNSSSGGGGQAEDTREHPKTIFYFLDQVQKVPIDRFAVRPRPRTIVGQILTICILAATAVYIAYLVQRWKYEPPTTRSTLAPALGAGPFPARVECRARSGCLIYNGISVESTDGAATRADAMLPIKKCIPLPYTKSVMVPLVYSVVPEEALTLQWDASSIDEGMRPRHGLLMGRQTRCTAVNTDGFCQEGFRAHIGPGRGGILYVSFKNDTRAASGERKDLFYPHLDTSSGAADTGSFPCTPPPAWAEPVQSVLRLDFVFYYAAWMQQEFWLYLWGSAGGAFGSFLELALGILFLWGIMSHLYLKLFEPAAVKLALNRPVSKKLEPSQPV